MYHDFNQFTPVVIVKLAEDIPNVLEAEWLTKEGRELHARSQEGSDEILSLASCLGRTVAQPEKIKGFQYLDARIFLMRHTLQ